MKWQLRLTAKINKNLQPIFMSWKLIQDLRVTEDKPSLVKQKCVVYEFECNFCESSYVGYPRALMNIAVGKHLWESHNLDWPNMHEHFNFLKKCRRKLECLIYEMLFIKERRLTLNTQADSIRAKLFNWLHRLTILCLCWGPVFGWSWILIINGRFGCIQRTLWIW